MITGKLGKKMYTENALLTVLDRREFSFYLSFGPSNTLRLNSLEEVKTALEKLVEFKNNFDDYNVNFNLIPLILEDETLGEINLGGYEILMEVETVDDIEWSDYKAQINFDPISLLENTSYMPFTK